jgi:hypothetical protein
MSFFRERHSHHSGLHINDAAEIVPIEPSLRELHIAIIRSVVGGVYCT